VYQKFVKRGLDLVLSFCALVVLSPLLLAISVWIKCDSPGPVLFRQKRVGKGKDLFFILKFRTMRTDTPKDVPTHLLQDPDAYITRSGHFLRKTSLDELPQIWNILVGQMSIVGPRPALWNQYDLLEERDKYGANDVTPGLTGWAQVNGRDELEIPVKAKLDGEYVARLSFGMDLKCFFLTIARVLTHKGVVEGGTGQAGRQSDQKKD
jgi:O-antigen biosynthesis protein WbqP